MKIACLCPTYKRPAMLQNLAACYMNQTYPADKRKLFVLDDAAQHRKARGPIHIETTGTRYHNLPAKYNRLLRLAHEWGADVISIWEDDDIYLPHYLADIAEAYRQGATHVSFEQVWSTYGCTYGEANLENAAGRFHASWSATLGTLHEIGGWPCTKRLDFDQQLGGLLRSSPKHVVLNPTVPGYVYRWGNPTYHGSQFGEGDWYEKVGQMDLSSDWVGALRPAHDQQTARLLEAL